MNWEIRKAKSYFNNFWMDVVKNGCDHLGHGTLNSVVSQELIDELSWFLTADTNLEKLKVTLIIFEWV